MHGVAGQRRDAPLDQKIMAVDMLNGDGLVVLFQRHDDRYVHEADIVGLNGQVALLRSVEGSPDEVWPTSPPCQQVHFEKRLGGLQVALAVGMAGASHWSVSVELDPTARRITFDVACRLQAAPVRLQSAYRLPDPRITAVMAVAGENEPRMTQMAADHLPQSTNLTASDSRSSALFAAGTRSPDVVFLVDGEPQAWLRGEAIAGAAAPIVRVEGERLTIECPPLVGRLPATVRWRYVIGRIG
jgi:hypothetical protein